MSPSDPSGTAEIPNPVPADAEFPEPALPRRPLNWILVAAAVVVLALIAALGVATWLNIREAPASADEDQITNVITDFIDYTNQGQNAKAQELVCSGMTVMQSLTDSPATSNPTDIVRITGISVDGDRATAIVTTSSRSTLSSDAGQESQNTLTMDFRNQGGWKVCTPQ
ncbi:Rv0361 family membrane protein [Tomitella biformata]|uniref:Rv0361 family membrane protein n=1 Tax=Tomitella biformata TaxID=630403 RepID=UPI000465830A|nr:hypothetical protein [Tomitella biformata]